MPFRGGVNVHSKRKSISNIFTINDTEFDIDEQQLEFVYEH